MPVIKIDGKEYDLDALSTQARQQLVSVQVTDQEINRLSAQLAIARTARNAYANALKALLNES